MMKTRAASGALAALLLASLPAVAQESAKPITWVAYGMTKEGKVQDAVALALKYDAPLLDKLLADGTITSWGLATPINHEAGFKWNLLNWVTLPNWGSVDKWVGSVMQQMQSRSAEETKALEQEGQAVYVERSHFDEVVRNVVLSPPAAGGAPPRYIFAGMSKVKDGQYEAGEKAFAPWWPIVDKLKAGGKVLSYGLQAQALHSDASFTFRDWYMLPDLAAVDAINAAAESGWTDANEAAYVAAFEREPHRDVILAILHVGGQKAQ